MSRNVTCFITKEKGKNDEFIPVTVKGVKKYVKNQKVYDEWIENEKQKQLLKNKSSDVVKEVVSKIIFGGNYVPPIFMTRLMGLNYDTALLCKCIEQNSQAFKYAHTKSFNNIHQKIGYLLAIINNTIGETQLDRPQTIKNMYVETDILEDKLVSNATRKRKDISHFLED